MINKWITTIGLLAIMAVCTFANVAKFSVIGGFDEKLLVKWTEFMETIDENTTEMVIDINSPGGSVNVLTVMSYDIHTFKGKVTTINKGMAMSAGFSLFLMGDERVSIPGALFMAHSAAYQLIPGTKKVIKEVEHILLEYDEVLYDRLKQLGLTDEELAEHFDMDIDNYLRTKTMKELGLVTKVIDRHNKG